MPEPHEKRIEVRSRDTDQYGHVNNAVYLTYAEEARDEWLARALGGVGDVAAFILARVAIDFRQEVTEADGEVVVRCGLVSLGRSSVCTYEHMFIRSGELAAESESVLVAYDWETRRARPLTEAERAALSA